LITVIYNFSESVYGRIGPGWFLFIVAALDYPAIHDGETNTEPLNSKTLSLGETAQSIAILHG
jgi:hypothetical protein